MCGILVLSVIGVILGFILMFVIEYWQVILAFFVILVCAAAVGLYFDMKTGDYSETQQEKKAKTQEKEDYYDSAALSAAIMGIMAEESRERHNGKCGGNCAACPPHYGYRYGRWYYGRCHNYGCQFGGNRGGGALD